MKLYRCTLVCTTSIDVEFYSDSFEEAHAKATQAVLNGCRSSEMIFKRQNSQFVEGVQHLSLVENAADAEA